eukprot:6194810-Pleurochrysis_carterae.AAC.2
MAHASREDVALLLIRATADDPQPSERAIGIAARTLLYVSTSTSTLKDAHITIYELLRYSVTYWRDSDTGIGALP